MKVALVHDYFNQIGGAERTFLELHGLFGKDASVYTILSDPEILKKLQLKNVKSFIKHFPFDHRYALPFFPIINKWIKIDNCDLLISDSHAYVKNIKKPAGSLHICYCYTPMRYAWDLKEFYLKNETELMRPIVALWLRYIQRWDYQKTKKVDHLISISKNVQARIKKYYNRKSEVIYPPVDTAKYRIAKEKPKEFYLVVSRLISQKRVDLAVNACKTLNKELIVLGNGPEKKRLEKIANKNIKILNIMGDDVIPYYQKCKGFLFCGEDDFGLTPVEAQACGRPVIAFGKGGALESVIEGKTGHFFYEQAPEALAKAILEFENMSFNPKTCRENAERFDVKIFRKKIKTFIEDKYKEFKDGKKKHNPT